MYFSIPFIVITILLDAIQSARILCVYPIPMFSHQIVFRSLTEELAKRGHELVVITTDPYLPKNHSSDNVKEIDVHDLSYDFWRKQISKRRSKSYSFPIVDFYNVLVKTANEIVDAQLKSPQVQKLIQNETEHFDLVILESVVRPAFFYTHRFKAPVIGVSSHVGMLFNYEATGTPTHPLLYSSMFGSDRFNAIETDQPCFWEKAKILCYYFYETYSNWRSAEEENAFGRKHFGENTPDIRELANNMDILLLNANPIWAGIRAAPPSVIYVGGLHIKQPKNLPAELKSYLDGCKAGVVYMSLGSNIKSSELPPDKLQVFMKVFRDLPYCVLWKWESDELPGKADNVKFAKWLPQLDLLGHPNVRVFITQGGLQSTDEAIEAEVPLIGIPFVVDQHKNVQKYLQHGVGIALSIDTISKDSLRRAILTVFKDESYRQRMRQLKRLLRDQPNSALERAVWWVEYVLRHGGARHLRSPAAGASLYRYLPPDVLAALLTALLACSLLAGCALRALCPMLRQSMFRNPSKTKTA